MLKVTFPEGLGTSTLMLREPSGREELELAEGHPMATARALARMLHAVSFEAAFQRVLSLSLAVRDRLLAAIYRSCFGDAIESVLRCQSCTKPFEFGFSLEELLLELDQPKDVLPSPDRANIFSLNPTLRFRLPRVEDELASLELEESSIPDFILSRCLVAGDIARDGHLIDAALEQIAPIVRSTLDAHCPHCQQVQSTDFDLVTYVSQCFSRERTMFCRELHCLATSYRFGYEEILAIPRGFRQEMVALLLASHERGAR